MHFQIGDIRVYLVHGKDDVLTKAQVPIWDVPIGREPIKMEGSELEGEAGAVDWFCAWTGQKRQG